jgi:S1-C subfamily serine protease
VGRYWCLTEGVVSRFHRQQKATGDAIPAVDGNAPLANDARAASGTKPVWMSITADYTIGSSGGPVFNPAGEVVGMVSRTVTSSQTKPENANRRRPLAGETIVFKDCVSTETLHKLLSGHPQAAPADKTAKR